MTFASLTLRGTTIRIHSAVGQPDFSDRIVLSADPWDYVTLWLRRSDNSQALFYWEQARQFYDATEFLSDTASPLTFYYCCLNATKALLATKGRSFSEAHGVSGEASPGKTALRNEKVLFYSSGVLPELARYLGDTIAKDESHNLYDLLYNLPFIHRAFTLTFKSASELFLPLHEARFVRKEGSTEAWFCADVEEKHVRPNLCTVLPRGFHLDRGVKDHCVIRRSARFEWSSRPSALEKNLARLSNYHARTRRNILPVLSSPNHWYLKKEVQGKLDKSIPTLIFAAIHRLSELSRYDPIRLSRHLDCQHNWLLSEFLRIAPAQFIGQVASEITGKEFITPFALSTG